MNKKQTFVLSDESMNSYGYRIPTSKLNLERFKKNPVMLYNHDELIGSWDNIRIEGDLLLADPVYMDAEGEDLSKKIKSRVESGFLRGASLGIYVDQSFENNNGETLVVGEVFECSLCDIPSNGNAIAMYARSGERLMGEKLKLELKKIQTKTKNMETKQEKEVIPASTYDELGLALGASSTEVATAVSLLVANNKEMSKKLEAISAQKINDLIERGESEGRITGSQKQQFEKLAEVDFDLARQSIDALPARQALAGKEKPSGGTSGGDRSAWSFSDWRKRDLSGLLAIKLSEPARYQEIIKK